MNEQKPLIRVEELVVKLNEYFQTDFYTSTINRMKNEGVIPAVDTRRPGTKKPRWKYNFEDVKEAIENLSDKG